MYTDEFNLPTVQELTVKEVKLGTSSLLAGSFHLGKHCLTPNDEFMLCRYEEADPRKCLQEGKAVTKCSLDFFRKIKESCLQEFDQYTNCIDRSSMKLDLYHCRNTQKVFDKCVLEHLEIERPDWGFYSRPRVLDTARPKPKGYESPEFPNPAVDHSSSDVSERKAAKYGVRKYFYN